MSKNFTRKCSSSLCKKNKAFIFSVFMDRIVTVRYIVQRIRLSSFVCWIKLIQNSLLVIKKSPLQHLRQQRQRDEKKQTVNKYGRSPCLWKCFTFCIYLPEVTRVSPFSDSPCKAELSSISKKQAGKKLLGETHAKAHGHKHNDQVQLILTLNWILSEL